LLRTGDLRPGCVRRMKRCCMCPMSFSPPAVIRRAALVRLLLMILCNFLWQTGRRAVDAHSSRTSATALYIQYVI
jgi:hypothetical protein